MSPILLPRRLICLTNVMCHDSPTHFDLTHFPTFLQRLPHYRSSGFADAEYFSQGATVQLSTTLASLVVHLVRRNGKHSHGRF
jgi:hypothetical protein